MNSLWITIFYQPIYNLLVFFVSIFPGNDIGLAVIAVTILIKIIIYPLTKRSIKSQILLKAFAPKLKEIQEQYKNDKKLQAEKTFALYKEHKINPFSGCLPILLQLPIIIAVYRVFLDGITKNEHLRYAFIEAPQMIGPHFLSLIDLSKPSIFLAILAGVTQYIQLRYSPTFQKPENTPTNSQEAFTQNFQKQMVYMLPILMLVIGISLPGAVALYLVISNIVTIVQERMIQKSLAK